MLYQRPCGMYRAILAEELFRHPGFQKNGYDSAITTGSGVREMRKKSLTLPGLALGAALLGGCASAGIPGAGSEQNPYPTAQPPKSGDIIHLATGIVLPFDQAMEMISAAKIIYIGEMHTNFQAHEAQRRIIEELDRRFPGQVAIGMEMFREPQQPALERWVRGELSELQFLKESKWFENWGSDFGNYRGILNLARDRRLDVIALNPSKELQKQFAEAGSGPLPAELAGKVPDTDFTDPYQRALLQAIFAGHAAGRPPATEPEVGSYDALQEMLAARKKAEATTAMFERFYRTQVLWEETMASRIVDYLKSPAGAAKKMVVIAGGFHVRHGLGVPRKALRRAAWPYVIVLPTEIEIPEELREELVMDVDAPELPLLPGDFLWMVDYEDVAKQKVRLGVMLRTDEGSVVAEKVLPESPAEEVGIQAGDVFVSIDDFPIQEQGDVVLAISGKKPGETAKVVLRREGGELTFNPVLTVPPGVPPKHGEKKP